MSIAHLGLVIVLVIVKSRFLGEQYEFASRGSVRLVHAVLTVSIFPVTVVSVTPPTGSNTDGYRLIRQAFTCFLKVGPSVDLVRMSDTLSTPLI